MTCLYCGKKLGFFSRYKDTPFCSEDHLREHQTELEQALIERLGGAGTKGAPTAAGGRNSRDNQAVPAPPTEIRGGHSASGQSSSSAPSVHELERKSSFGSNSAPSTHEISPSSRFSDPANESSSAAKPHWSELKESTPPQASMPQASMPQSSGRPQAREQRHGSADPNSILHLPRPLADTPVDVAAFGDNAPKRQREEYSPGPPLSEKFFSDFPALSPDLNLQKPWMSPSAFAIIVQADCCVPSIPSLLAPEAPPGEEEQFEIDLEAMPMHHLALEPLDNRGGALQPFGENWLFFPEEATAGDLCFGPADLFPLQEELHALEYEATSETLHFAPLGHRDSLEPRTRQRFPYPASQVLSMDPSFPIAIEEMPLGTGLDWDPIQLPATAEGSGDANLSPSTLQGIDFQPEGPGQPAFARLEAPATHSALEQGIAEAATLALAAAQDFEASDLPDSSHTPSPFEAIDEPTQPLSKPSSGTTWQPEAAFPRAAAEYRSPAVNFPALFQLGPSLPPRPSEGRPS